MPQQPQPPAYKREILMCSYCNTFLLAHLPTPSPCIHCTQGELWPITPHHATFLTARHTNVCDTCHLLKMPDNATYPCIPANNSHTWRPITIEEVQCLNEEA